MTAFLIRRIFWAIFLFFVATIITYLIFWVIPSDPAALAAGKSATPADIARVRHFLHLDEPIWKQYLRFVWQRSEEHTSELQSRRDLVCRLLLEKKKKKKKNQNKQTSKKKKRQNKYIL